MFVKLQTLRLYHKEIHDWKKEQTKIQMKLQNGVGSEKLLNEQKAITKKLFELTSEYDLLRNEIKLWLNQVDTYQDIRNAIKDYYIDNCTTEKIKGTHHKENFIRDVKALCKKDAIKRLS